MDLGVQRLTLIEENGNPGPEAFQRFYRQITDRDDLPTIPEVARHLMLAVNRPNTTGRQLAGLIERDPSLATKLLSLVNSAFFGLRRPVSDLGQAVMLLGFGSVRDLVMTISLWGALGDAEPTTKRRRKSLWIHCASVGATAKLLAKEIGRIDAGEALSAGLLHDIGKLLLGLRLGATYWQMLDQAEQDGENPAAVELDVLGVHHGTIGKYMLQLWGLPQGLFEAIGAHHAPLENCPAAGVAEVVNAANRLVDRVGEEFEEENLAVLQLLAPGKITAESWLALQQDIENEQQQIAAFFSNT